jgi:uncharacterized protein (TIGR02266 family)
MVDQRRDKRAPASLKVKYKSANVDQFIEQFGTDVSRGGMFIKTKTPLEMGTLLKLELQLSDASPVIQGMGRVCWRRAASADPGLPVGMGLKFIKLEDLSRATIERIVEKRGDTPSRFDQTEGAELSFEPEDSAPASAPARAVAPARPLAAPPRTAPAAPAPAAAPRPAHARPAVAGLFATSPIASQPPEAPSESAARSSFFPPAPAPESPKPASARMGHGPAGAFGSAKAAPLAAPAPVAKPPDEEEAAFDRLFDEVQRSASLAPAARSAAPARTPSAAPLAPRAVSAAPAAPAIASEMDDVFGALGEEEGLRSVPPARPPRTSAPDSAAEALAALANPQRASSPGRSSSPGLSLPLPDADDDFGEADIGGGMTAPPPPAGSLRPPALTLPEPAAPAKRSALPLILAVLVLLGVVGGYVYYQRMLVAQAAQQAEVERAAAAAAAAEAQEALGVPGEAAPTAGAGAAAAQLAQGGAPAAVPTVAATPAVPVQVELSSVPRGADVMVGEQHVGVTPLRVELPIGQPANVSVKSPGYAAETRVITAVAGQEPLRFKLEPLDYLLFVRTEPPEAELEIGTKTIIAPGPLELGHLDGGVLVTVSKPGHQRMTRPVRLEEFAEREGKMRAEIDVRLSPLPGFKESVPAVVKPRPKPPTRKPAASSAAAPAAPSAETTPAPAPAAPAAPAPAPSP